MPALRQRLLKPIDNRFAGVVIYGKSTVVGPVSLRCQTEPCTNRRPAASLLLLKLKTAVKFLIVCVNILIHTTRDIVILLLKSDISAVMHIYACNRNGLIFGYFRRINLQICNITLRRADLSDIVGARLQSVEDGLPVAARLF